MMTEEMQAALNKQINEELFSAYIYASMSSYFEDMNLKGFASWMNKHAEEEVDHAKRIVKYLHDRNARVVYTTISAPKTAWEDPTAVLKDAYDHECKISECINKLSSLAVEQSDHATHAFLEWFVTEQVEEEALVNGVLQQLKLAQGAPAALFLLDNELRQSTPIEA